MNGATETMDMEELQKEEKIEKEAKRLNKMGAGRKAWKRVQAHRKAKRIRRDKLQRIIDEAKETPFSLFLVLAVSVDFSDFIPVVGTVINFLLLPLLWYVKIFKRGLLKRLGVSRKATATLYIISALDLVPYVSYLPLNAVSSAILWRKTYKKIKEKEKEKRIDELQD